jgi:hypothetical protein
MHQTGKDVQEYNIDEHSDSYKTLLKHNTPPAAAVWRQLMSAWNARIHHFTDDTYGETHIIKELVDLRFATFISLLVDKT